MAESKTPAKSGSTKNAPETTHWAFTGPYPASYLPPDRVSRAVKPGEVVEWGEGGPPDGNWEPAEAPPKKDEGAPSKSTEKE
jgi:hypothetical protein